MKNLINSIPRQYKPISAFYLFAIILVSISVTSCSKNSNSKVTVIEKSERKNWRDDFVGQEYYSVVTPSGDTMNAIVDEEIYLNNTLPFPAIMRTNNMADHGFIETENNPVVK